MEEEPIFALIRKIIFNGMTQSTTLLSYLFIRKSDHKLVVRYLKVCKDQVYYVILIILRIFTSLKFKTICNLYIHLSQICNFNQG